MNNIKILKLGGSLFTNKDASVGTVKANMLDQLSNEISHYCLNYAGSLILVFGTGSFGHQPAKKYNVLQTFNATGTIETYKSVICLSNLLLESLNKYGIHAMPIDIMSCVTAQNGIIKTMQIDTIKLLLANNFLPIICGNVVMDMQTKVNIVSSDQIAAYLSKKLNALRLGFGSIEHGVYDKNNAVIKEINSHNFDELKKHIGHSQYTDVTNGMLGKVNAILQIPSLQAYIFNATKKGNISRFLNGETIGTKIVS